MALKSQPPIYAVLILLSFFLLFPANAEAKKKKGPEFTEDLLGNQPYPHQWIEARGKKGVSLIGQSYRPRPDLFVMELNSFPDGETEIKSVKLRTKDGKVIEGKIRRVPASFMPTARRNFQSAPIGDTSTVPQNIGQAS